MRWECRYYSYEMLYLDVKPIISAASSTPNDDKHSEAQVDRWTFAEFLAGEHDGYIQNLFGETALQQLKQEVQLRASAIRD